MKDIKQGESHERYEMIFDGVCECQKWVENANQTQLKPIIWYTNLEFPPSLQNPYLRPWGWEII